MQTSWDERSKTYPRYGEKFIMQDKQTIISWCEENGVKFDGEILSVGAGSGVLEILIAKKYQSKITAVDISEKMLEILKIDAKTQGVEEKILTVKSDWNDFKSDKKFNMTIACMSPAISSEDDFEKLINFSSNLVIHVGWASSKENAFLSKLLSKFELSCSLSDPARSCLRTQQIYEILERKGIKYQSKIFDGGWEEIMSEDEAYEYAKSALLREDLSIDDKHIKSVIDEFSQNGVVTVVTKAKKGIVLFSL